MRSLGIYRTYSDALLDRRRQVHRSDKESISVDDVTLTQKDGTYVAPRYWDNGKLATSARKGLSTPATN
jgi:hypothetical protein